MLILTAVVIVSILIASLPWFTPNIRMGVLTTQLIASAVLPFVFAGFYITWQIWAIVLAPGALIALCRLVIAIRLISD